MLALVLAADDDDDDDDDIALAYNGNDATSVSGFRLLKDTLRVN